MPNTIITLLPVQTLPHMLRLDVHMKNIPPDFLGMAFDLVLNGKWEFDRAELGPSFRAHSSVFHLATAQFQNNRVIFGLVDSRGGQQLLDFHSLPLNGLFETDLVSFYFRVKEPLSVNEVHFENTVLSVYKDGLRHDIQSVTWEGTTLSLQKNTLQSSQEVQQGPLLQSLPSTQDVNQSKSLVPSMTQVSLSIPHNMEPMTVDHSIGDVYFTMLVFLCFALFVFGLILVFLRWKYPRNPRS